MGINHVFVVFSDSPYPKIGGSCGVTWGSIIWPEGDTLGLTFRRALGRASEPLKMGKSGKMSKKCRGCVGNGPK